MCHDLHLRVVALLQMPRVFRVIVRGRVTSGRLPLESSVAGKIKYLKRPAILGSKLRSSKGSHSQLYGTNTDTATIVKYQMSELSFILRMPKEGTVAF
jgi:hypothetical protein